MIQKITYSIVSDENKIFNRWVTKKENLIYLDDYSNNLPFNYLPMEDIIKSSQTCDLQESDQLA